MIHTEDGRQVQVLVVRIDGAQRASLGPQPTHVVRAAPARVRPRPAMCEQLME